MSTAIFIIIEVILFAILYVFSDKIGITAKRIIYVLGLICFLLWILGVFGIWTPHMNF